jgi:hypothetical protein
LETITQLPRTAEAYFSALNLREIYSSTQQMTTDDLLFSALGSVRINPTLTLDLLSLAWERQQESGFLPAGMAHSSEDEYQIPALPIAGFLLEKIYRNFTVVDLQDSIFKTYVKKALDFHRWWHKYWVDENSSLLVIPKIWENSFFSTPSKGKITDTSKSIFFNSLMIASNESLIHLGGKLGLDISDLIDVQELSVFCLNEDFWDEQKGTYRIDSSNLPVEISEIAPLLGGIPTQDQAEQILNRLCLKYAIDQVQPVLPADGGFVELMKNPLYNWMLVTGLQRYDMSDMAEFFAGFYLQGFNPEKVEDVQRMWQSAMYLNIRRA